MICEINKRSWVIREVPERILIKQIQKYEEGRVIMANGLTNFQKQIIEINQEIDEDVKRHTLLHELMHAYLRTFITWDSLTDITEEQMCDISANAHDIIHEIVENYFKEKIRRREIMIVPNELEMLDNEMSVWTVATGVVSPFKRASRKAVEFIQKQEGFVGVHPAENGTLWLFKTKEDAINARRKMDDKGIHTGDNIVEVYIEKKYVK